MSELLKNGKCHVANRARYGEPPNFFPTNGGGVVTAIKFCADCPVRQECLNFALSENIEHGVWGGKSERARALMARDLINA